MADEVCWCGVGSSRRIGSSLRTSASHHWPTSVARGHQPHARATMKQPLFTCRDSTRGERRSTSWLCASTERPSHSLLPRSTFSAKDIADSNAFGDTLCRSAQDLHAKSMSQQNKSTRTRNRSVTQY